MLRIQQIKKQLERKKKAKYLNRHFIKVLILIINKLNFISNHGSKNLNHNKMSSPPLECLIIKNEKYQVFAKK